MVDALGARSPARVLPTVPASDVAAPSAPPPPTLATPLAPVSLPRAKLPESREGSHVNAVLLGIMAIPAAAIALIAPTGSEAQAATQRTVDLNGAGAREAVNTARSELFAARKTAEDPHVTELKQKVSTLVDARFGGNVRAAFDHYAGADGQVNADELSRLLSDARVGNFLTRGAWVSGIMERVDTNGNGRISWTEFQTVMATAPQAA